MMERSQDSYPLLRQFREFYAELARLRSIAQGKRDREDAAAPARAASTASATAAASLSGTTSMPSLSRGQGNGALGTLEEPRTATVQAWQAMAHYLDQKMYEVNLSASAISHDHLNELVYIMASFADETFVCLVDWPGKEHWRDHLMEVRLFHTQIAGQEIFRRIDRLLARRDFVAEELAAVYLMTLALGFKGQYLRVPEAVDAYRKKLFDRLLMTDPELGRDSRRLFPDAYRHTIVEGSPVRLPEPRTWWLVVGAIVAAWLVFSTIAWIALTGQTRQALGVAMSSLARVTNRQMETTTTGRWKPIPFQLQGGAFRMDLPKTLALNSADVSRGRSSSVAPLLLAVNTMSGNAEASSAQIKAWLSRGSTAFLTDPDGVPIRARPVASAEPMENPPGGVTTSAATLFFLVDPAVREQELADRPELIFPVSGVPVAALTLYLPEASTTTGAQ